MKRKTITAAIITTGLLLSLGGMQAIELTEAMSFSYYDVSSMPFIVITSPTNQTVCKNSTIPLNIYLGTENLEYNYSSQRIVYETIQWLNYSLDGASYQFLSWTLPQQANTIPPITTYANTTLNNLSNGVHSLDVFGETTFGTNMSSDIIFWVYANNETIPNPLPLPTPSPSQSPTPSPIPSPSPTLTPTPSPTITEIPLTAIAITFLTITILVGAILMARKREQ